LSICVVVGTLYFLNTIPTAESSTSDNLSGYAWSDTIGWISMNCTDPGTCGGSNYGVTVAQDGSLSGFAWSEHIGWISFNSGDVGGCPNGTCAPRINRATGAVQGWAKALSGGGANAGGWDGYISLSGGNYGVTVAGCDWTGYAWGSDVVGWVKFDGHANDVLGTGHACQANLKSESITLRSGSMTQGSTVTFNASVKNESLMPLRFVDTFKYKYDSDTSSTTISSVSYLTTPLNPGPSVAEVSGSFVVSKSGLLRVSHCADDGDRIAETNEADNCSTYTIIVKGGNINGPDCTIPPGQATCSNVTWSTSGLSNARSIKQNGTQFETVASHLGMSRTLTNGLTTFSVYDGTTLIASDQANALCASDSSWDSTIGTCTGVTPLAPALEFDTTDPNITAGTPTKLTWKITGTADSCWARNDQGIASWTAWKDFTAVILHEESVSPLVTTTFYLECWNKGVSSGEKPVTITVTPPSALKSATISAGACTIPAGSATCNTLVTWTSANLTAPSIKQNKTGTFDEFSKLANSPTTGQVRSVTRTNTDNTDTFRVDDGGTAISPEYTVTANCPATAPWDGDSCELVAGPPPLPGATPTLRAQPRVVDEGENTRLTWDTDGNPGTTGVDETTCILKGGEFGTTGVTVPTDTFNLATDAGSIETPVYANTTYSISCPANATANVKVEIVPRYFPS
jgi:hypothetical protein